MMTEVSEKRCILCGDMRPITAFSNNGTHRPKIGGRDWAVGPSKRSTCRRCLKERKRRRLGVRRRADITAAGRKPRRTRAQSLVAIRRLLTALLEARCTDQGENAGAVAYRVRYRTNDTFRLKEIARTWTRKASSGIMRTDARSTARVECDGSLDSRTIQRLFAAASSCPYCGMPLDPRKKTLDHILPTSRGGDHSRDNVVVCCSSCNSKKLNRTPLEWALAGGWPGMAA